jgi:hypothetical protein
MRGWTKILATAGAIVAFGSSTDRASAHLAESHVTETADGIGMIVVAALTIVVGAWMLGARHRPSHRIRNPPPIATRPPRGPKVKRRPDGRGRKL